MYQFQNFRQISKLDFENSWETRGEGCPNRWKGLIAFRGRVRTIYNNTREAKQVYRIGLKYGPPCALCEKSMKFDTDDL